MDTHLIAQSAFLVGYTEKEALSPVVKGLGAAALGAAGIKGTEAAINAYDGKSSASPEVAALQKQNDGLFDRLLSTKKKLDTGVESIAADKTKAALAVQDSKNKEDLKQYLGLALGGGMLLGGGAAIAMQPKRRKPEVEE